MAPLTGRPLVRHAAAALNAAVRDGVLQTTVAVVPASRGALARELKAEGCALEEAPDADRGLAHSLRAGVAAAERLVPDGPAAILVALGDQPDVDPAVIAELVRRWRATRADAVRPRYSGEPRVPGHPVLVDRRLWPAVSALRGDSGLNAVLREGAVRVEFVDVAGRNPDIDTRADLAARDQPEES